MSEPGQPPSGDADPGNLPARNPSVSARVPESVSRGVFSTGVIIMTGSSEFIIDFILRMSHPHRVVARVVMPVSVIPQVITAMRDNLGKFVNRFGAVPQQPKPEPGSPRPSVQEIYDDLRLPDEMLSGAYANAVIVGHTSSEFYFDFLATFYPRSVVSSRVFLSAPQVPGFLDALANTHEEYVRKYGPKKAATPSPTAPLAIPVPILSPIPQVQTGHGSAPLTVPGSGQIPSDAPVPANPAAQAPATETTLHSPPPDAPPASPPASSEQTPPAQVPPVQTPPASTEPPVDPGSVDPGSSKA